MTASWTDDAACRGKGELFFAPNRNSDGAPLGGGFDFGPALAICRNECPVRMECRAWAIEAGEIDRKGRAVQGVVAGLAPDPRAKPSLPSLQPVARCGTESGYNRHRRLGEPACDPCLRANRVAAAFYKKRRRAS